MLYFSCILNKFLIPFLLSDFICLSSELSMCLQLYNIVDVISSHLERIRHLLKGCHQAGGRLPTHGFSVDICYLAIFLRLNRETGL